MHVFNTITAWKWAVSGLLALPLVLTGQDLNLSPTYAGEAFALQVTQPQQSPVTLAFAGPAPASGGQQQNYLPSATLAPGVTAYDLNAGTFGAARQNRSHASLSGLNAWLGAHHLTAQWVTADAQATAGFLDVPTAGKSTLNALILDGTPIAVTGAVNQTILLPDGQLVINEQFGSSSRNRGSLTVNAIDFVVNGVGRVIAASATARVINTPTVNSGP